MDNGMLKKPEWIRKRLFNSSQEDGIKKMVRGSRLHTVCREARCPNIGECFSSGTATFLLLGNICTRSCKFCNISGSKGELELDRGEPIRVAEAVAKMGLKYVVLTSVTRDDLPDGGASIFCETVGEIKKRDSSVMIEVLVSDLEGNEAAIKEIVNSGIVVFNHNLETVKRLYAEVRPEANYERSLKVLELAKRENKQVKIKTGIMAGLGESDSEILELMQDFYNIGGEIITIGQYLAPGKEFYPVRRYVTPEQFEEYKRAGEGLGLEDVTAGPFVRSSYQAEKIIKKNQYLSDLI